MPAAAARCPRPGCVARVGRNGVACTACWRLLPGYLTGALYRQRHHEFTREFLTAEAVRQLTDLPALEPAPVTPQTGPLARANGQLVMQYDRPAE